MDLSYSLVVDHDAQEGLVGFIAKSSNGDHLDETAGHEDVLFGREQPQMASSTTRATVDELTIL